MNSDVRLVPAADKTLKIIEHMARHIKEGCGVTEIANALHYNKGTVHPILQTLISNGWVERDLSGKYYLTSKLAFLGSQIELESKLTSDFLLVANEMEHECGELINLHLLKSMTHVILASKVVSSVHTIRVDFPIGATIPVIASSAGKCLICEFDDTSLKRIFQECHARYTDTTIMEEDAFLKEIHQVAEQGYAFNKGEYEDGVCSIAVPVRNGSGNITASMNIVVPETRFSGERQKELLGLLLEKATYLSSLRGYRATEE